MKKQTIAYVAAAVLFGAISAHAQVTPTPAPGNAAGTRPAPVAPSTSGVSPSPRTVPSEALGGRNPAGIANPDRPPLPPRITSLRPNSCIAGGPYGFAPQTWTGEPQGPI
jgi:hypothetical protein